MSITLFHGSPKKFDDFKIGEEFIRHDISVLAEGIGIYMTEKTEMAKNYGTYLYEINLNEESITDFTKGITVNKLIDTISKEVEVDIQDLIEVDLIVESVLNGGILTTKLYREINNFLDSTESFYEQYGHLITYEDDCVFEKIKQSFLSNIKDTIKYYDRGFNANIYICFRNPENLKIVSVTES